MSRPATFWPSRRDWAARRREQRGGGEPSTRRRDSRSKRGADMKVLVIHGAGMNMRGKVQTEVFGTLTLPEYDVKIREYAGALGIQVEIFHSNIEGEVINRLYAAHEDRKSTRLNSSHTVISYAVFCLKKKNKIN